MFGYTVFLKIGNLAASSLTDMYKDSYQLIGCEFGFAQGIDIKGQAQTEVKGGTFYVTYPHLPNRDMIQWMLDARKYQSGAIVVHDNQGSTLERYSLRERLVWIWKSAISGKAKAILRPN